MFSHFTLKFILFIFVLFHLSDYITGNNFINVNRAEAAPHRCSHFISLLPSLLLMLAILCILLYQPCHTFYNRQ